MESIERLEAIEDIHQLKARYFRCLDEKDWDGFGAVFADDAAMDISGEKADDAGDIGNIGDGLIVGRAAIVELVSSALEGVTTVHHGHTPEITVTDENSASGIWAMEDHLWWPEDSPLRTLHGYGHYHERYRRSDGVWQIASTLLTRLRTDFEMDEP